MERLKLLRQIYSRLARLEDDREVARLEDRDVKEIDIEMNALRTKLQLVMNSSCPIFQGGE